MLNTCLLSGKALKIFAICSFLFSFHPIFADNIIIEERNISGFTKVIINGDFDVYLAQGKDELVKIEAESKLVKLVRTENKNGELNIFLDKDLKKFKIIKIFITFTDLEQLYVLGNNNIRANETLDFKNSIRFIFGGNSNINMDFEA